MSICNSLWGQKCNCNFHEQINEMRTTKIQISPAMREFNEAVEICDSLTDYKHDKESAIRLLVLVKHDPRLPAHAEWLANAMAGIAVKH